jgi:hypothetical protein
MVYVCSFKHLDHGCVTHFYQIGLLEVRSRFKTSCTHRGVHYATSLPKATNRALPLILSNYEWGKEKVMKRFTFPGGRNIRSGVITSWVKTVGDTFVPGEIVAYLSMHLLNTNVSFAIEFTAHESGTLLEQCIAEGQQAFIGDIMAYYQPSDIH